VARASLVPAEIIYINGGGGKASLMKTHAAVLYEPKSRFVIEELTLDEPHQGEVLIHIAASGVCHSDYHLVSGATKHPMPVVIGHEGAGVVEAVGPGVTRVQVGDHVVLNWAPDCGHCFYCLRGKPNLCETFVEPIWAGTMLDGTPRLHLNGQPVYHFCGLASFSEYAVVPQESCVPIRQDVPLTVAALVGCAVATGVGAAMYTAGVRPGESVVVFGCGGVGLNILQGAALCGAETIIAVDTNPAKMQMVRQFGATHALMSDENTIKAIREITGGRGAEYAFEAVGIPAVQELSLDAVRPGGMVVMAGLAPMGTGTNLPGAIITRQEKVIKGSYYGTVNSSRDFPMMLDLYAAGKLKLDELVTKEYPLSQINEAYDAMLGGNVARGVVVF
jgi:S-(hydroxymethyl)glutathione dehydrogenase/alcohol dehydrogenase